ncbi:hypothetical protein D3C85_1064100 [compost metagenome]
MAALPPKPLQARISTWQPITSTDPSGRSQPTAVMRPQLFPLLLFPSLLFPSLLFPLLFQSPRIPPASSTQISLANARVNRCAPAPVAARSSAVTKATPVRSGKACMRRALWPG